MLRYDDLNGIESRDYGIRLAQLIKERSKMPLSIDDIAGFINGSNECCDWAQEVWREMKPFQTYNGSDVLFFKGVKGYISADNWMGYEQFDPFTGIDRVTPWTKIIKKNTRLVELQADHFTMLEGECLPIVVNEVSSVITNANPGKVQHDKKEQAFSAVVTDAVLITEHKVAPKSGDADRLKKGSIESTVQVDTQTEESNNIIINIRKEIKSVLAEKLKYNESEIDENESFDEYGIDSIILTVLVKALEDRFDIEITSDDILENNSVYKLAKYIECSLNEESKVNAL